MRADSQVDSASAASSAPRELASPTLATPATPATDEHLCHYEPSSMPAAETHTVIDLGPIRRVALMVTPEPHGQTLKETDEAIAIIGAVLKQQNRDMTVTLQNVFLRRAEDAEPCLRVMRDYWGDRLPATNLVIQPPCGGQALAIEAWAVGGPGTTVGFPEPGVVTVSYDGLRWVYVGGIMPAHPDALAYDQSRSTLDQLAERLTRAGASFQDVVRTWLYMGGITELEGETERYRELNRARSDFFAEQEAAGRMKVQRGGSVFYPASTGIGTLGRGLTVGCVALQTARPDVRLQPIENPRQTSAFQYAARFSAKSPKFSRAMTVVLGDYATTWVSGTASIVNSESMHGGDIQRQTHQTIDNIERLIGSENFARHGLTGHGAELSDLAKIRVYVKRQEDYAACRAICERRFGRLPAVYALADVCRAELLVEIEGVAFSSRHAAAVASGEGPRHE